MIFFHSWSFWVKSHQFKVTWVTWLIWQLKNLKHMVATQVTSTGQCKLADFGCSIRSVNLRGTFSWLQILQKPPTKFFTRKIHSCSSMNNLLSLELVSSVSVGHYLTLVVIHIIGLIDVGMIASDKDLPVLEAKIFF